MRHDVTHQINLEGIEGTFSTQNVYFMHIISLFLTLFTMKNNILVK